MKQLGNLASVISSAMITLIIILITIPFLSCTNESKEIAISSDNKTEFDPRDKVHFSENTNHFEQLNKTDLQFRKIRKVVNIIEHNIDAKTEIVTTLDLFINSLIQIRLKELSSSNKGKLTISELFDCDEIFYSLDFNDADDSNAHDSSSSSISTNYSISNSNITKIDFSIASCHKPDHFHKLIHIEYNTQSRSIENKFYPQTLNILKNENLNSNENQNSDFSSSICKSKFNDDEIMNISCSNFNVSLFEVFGRNIIIKSLQYDSNQFQSFSGNGIYEIEPGNKQEFSFTLDKEGKSQFSNSTTDTGSINNNSKATERSNSNTSEKETSGHL